MILETLEIAFMREEMRKSREQETTLMEIMCANYSIPQQQGFGVSNFSTKT